MDNLLLLVDFRHRTSQTLNSDPRTFQQVSDVGTDITAPAVPHCRSSVLFIYLFFNIKHINMERGGEMEKS